MFSGVIRNESGELDKAEKQVLKAAKTYLESSDTEDSVYCMTAWGVKARCWVVKRGDKKLVPLFGPDEAVWKESYIDADSDNGIFITASMDLVKEMNEA